MKQLITVAIALLLSATAWSNNSILRDNYPDRYVVVKGDTLWGISGKFLTNPARWKEIWSNNKHIKNPHRIYPGDVLRVVFVDGKPMIQINGGDVSESMSRSSSFNTAIPMVPLNVINTFLNANRFVSAGTSKVAPYIVAIESERVIAGKGDIVYARGNFPGNERFSIFRSSKNIVDPETGYSLGREAQHVANVRVMGYQGSVAKLYVEESTQEIRVNDFLLPQRKELDMSDYYPSMPDRLVSGQIAAIHEGATQAGRWQVVILNRGFNQGLKPGNVLSVGKKDRIIVDERRGDKVRIPGDKVGEVVVFRVFENMSYALVMRVEDTLHVKDFVSSPQ